MGSPKPVDRSIGLFPDDQLLRIQQAYGLASMLVLPFFAVDGAILDMRRRSRTARKVVVETDRGVGFLKELPWYCSTVDFAVFQTEVLGHLGRNGAPVAPPWSTADGSEFFHDRLTGSIFMLHPYIEGRGWGHGAEDAKSAGAALATMHAAGADLPPMAFATMQDVFGTSLDLVGLLMKSWTGPTSALDDVRSLARASTAAVTACREAAGDAGYGRVLGAVHGDFNPFNLIYDVDSPDVRAIVDFDNACRDDPAHDLGEAIVQFGWVRFRGVSSQFGAVPQRFDPEAVAAVLHGYREVDEQRAVSARPLLPAVATAVALELSAIGLLAGYYVADDILQLIENARKLPHLCLDVINSVW